MGGWRARGTAVRAGGFGNASEKSATNRRDGTWSKTWRRCRGSLDIGFVWAAALCGVVCVAGCSGEDDDDTAAGDDDASEAVTPTSTPTPAPTPTPTATPSLDQVCGWDGIDQTPGPFDAWWQDRVFYEVFVRSFQDSGTGASADGDGDLRGLISRLDYLNDGDPDTDSDLGVTGLWLMPVFDAPSVHGYDVVDYYAINPDYGVEADLVELLEQAHLRDIKVIIDLPFNHTSSQHPWFQDARSAIDAEHRDWYVWSDKAKNADWHLDNGAYYYAAFDGSIPDLNFYSSEVQAEIARLYDYYMALGVDGFRLDGVKYLVEQGLVTEHSEATHCYLQGQRRYFAKHWPDRLIVGEVYDTTLNIDPYFGDGTNELPLAFDFPVADGIVDSINEESVDDLHRGLVNKNYYYPDPAMGAPFIRNHDMDRTGSVLPSEDARKLAAALMFSVPGTPFMYYGEEIGMTGLRQASDNHDNRRRSPMQWTGGAQSGFTEGTPWWPVNEDYTSINVAAQEGDPSSLLSWYKKLIRLRLDEEALRHGSWVRLTAAPAGIYAYLRGSGDRAVLVVANLTSAPVEGVTVDLSAAGSWNSGYELLTDTSVAGPIGQNFTVGALPAYGARWLRLTLDK